MITSALENLFDISTAWFLTSFRSLLKCDYLRDLPWLPYIIQQLFQLLSNPLPCFFLRSAILHLLHMNLFDIHYCKHHDCYIPLIFYTVLEIKKKKIHSNKIIWWKGIMRPEFYSRLSLIFVQIGKITFLLRFPVFFVLGNIKFWLKSSIALSFISNK